MAFGQSSYLPVQNRSTTQGNWLSPSQVPVADRMSAARMAAHPQRFSLDGMGDFLTVSEIKKPEVIPPEQLLDEIARTRRGPGLAGLGQGGFFGTAPGIAVLAGGGYLLYKLLSPK